MESFIAAVTVFVLAIFVGFEVIRKVPPTLHTPLTSGSNAISGVTILGSIVLAGTNDTLATVFATFNVVGGFTVTHRMLKMFKSRG